MNALTTEKIDNLKQILSPEEFKVFMETTTPINNELTLFKPGKEIDFDELDNFFLKGSEPEDLLKEKGYFLYFIDIKGKEFPFVAYNETRGVISYFDDQSTMQYYGCAYRGMESDFIPFGKNTDDYDLAVLWAEKILN